MTTQNCDVLVIGSGPAGCTIAPMLCAKGYKVTVLEKAHHPRFHIGESLLPANMPLLERMGVADEVKAIGMEKWGAEFVSPWHDHNQMFEFGDAWDKSTPMAYQVLRSDFDHILVKNARAKGVEVIEGCQAKKVDFLPNKEGVVVHAQHDDGSQSSFQARFVVDASGRDTLLSNQLQLKERSEKHNSVAIFAHFSGAKRHEGRLCGNITIFWFEHGWFWFIPLVDGATSIGMVTWPYYMKTRKERSLEQFLLDGIAQSPVLQARLAMAQMQGPATATGNFSYSSKRCYGDNYLLLGDAYAFIDPVFSSGVWLAMNSGEVGAGVVDTCLREPAKAPAALREFERVMHKGPKEFSWFIYRVTNPTMRELFISPSEKYKLKEALLSLLAGDIFGQTPIWGRIKLLKGAYYLVSVTNFKRTFMAWKKRRFNIRRIAEVESSVTST